MRLTAYLTHLTGTLHLAVMRILRAAPSACQGAEMCAVRNAADSVRAERLILREPKSFHVRAEKALCRRLKSFHAQAEKLSCAG